MLTRLSTTGWSTPAATAVFLIVVGIPVLLIALVPAWRRWATMWGRGHPIGTAAVGAAIFGIGFATWSSRLIATVLGIVWFVVWVPVRPPI